MASCMNYGFLLLMKANDVMKPSYGSCVYFLMF